MDSQDPHEVLNQLLEESKEFVRDVAKDISFARLLSENEPIGELVICSLLDDEKKHSSLWVRLKHIAIWLKETEEVYRKQFPADWPEQGSRYDLSRKPEGFKTRWQIFKEIVEASESGALWSAELQLNDPVTVIKRFKRAD
jgi:hypothetical protein